MKDREPLSLALDRIDHAERQYRMAFVAAAGVEALGLGAFVLLANFADRTHLLLLVASVLVYSTIGIGLIALGAHVNRCTLRILKAIEIGSGE